LAFKVFLDTNMFMIMARRRVNVFHQIGTALEGRIEFIAPKAVVAELSGISREKSQRGRDATLALKLAEKCKEWQGKPAAGESTDDYLTRIAREVGGIVATGDKELRKRARNANIPVIYVTKDLRLTIEGIEPAYV